MFSSIYFVGICKTRMLDDIAYAEVHDDMVCLLELTNRMALMTNLWELLFLL